MPAHLHQTGNKTPLSLLEKKIGWNKMEINIPSAWEIDSLETTHLLIGEDSHPKIEIKWTEAPKRFSLDKYLKKFIKQTQAQLDISIQEQTTPAGFTHPQQSFDFFFFTWQGHGSTSDGCLIFCNHCKRLTMIRFFNNNPISSDMALTILQTFQDHPQTNHCNLWQLFGLSFWSPEEYTLKSYDFKPGAFNIILTAHKKELSFYSWGPASFLLSNSDLSEFALSRIESLEGFAKAGTCQKGPFLEWAFRQEKFKNASKLPLMEHFNTYTLFRICHDTEQNRILGIQINSAKQFESSLIKESILGDA